MTLVNRLERYVRQMAPHQRGRAAAKLLEECLAELSAQQEPVHYERLPLADKRIAWGDDFAGDAWVRWTAVGQHPYAAPLAQPGQQERAWLIEMPEARWGTGYFWTSIDSFGSPAWGEIKDAVRFSRKQDAEAVIKGLNTRRHSPMRLEACEHEWAAPVEPAAQEGK